MKTTINQIRKAISYDNNMVANHQGALYFITKKERKERIKQNLASNVFYDYCHSLDCFGYYEILRLLLETKIPKDIVKFLVETGNGGSTELDVIALQYGIGRTNYHTMQEVFENYLSVIPQHSKDIRKCFDGFANTKQSHFKVYISDSFCTWEFDLNIHSSSINDVARNLYKAHGIDFKEGKIVK